MSVNPQTTNTINNTEKNTFNITPTLSQLGQTIAQNIAPTFTQGSGTIYAGELNTSAFNFAGTGPATISDALGSYTVPTFNPSSTSGTLTITNAYGSAIDCLVTPGTNGAVTNACSLFVQTPTGATNNYTAVLGKTSITKVGIGTETPHQALSVVGGTSYAVTSVTTATYTALNTDNTLEVNFAGPVNLTLPAASASNSGQTFVIKDASGLAQTNPITVVTLGGTIDGAPSQVIGINYGILSVFSDGTNYYLSRSKLGSVFLSVTNVTTPTFTATKTQNILDVNYAGAVALTLPAASAANLGQLYVIKDTSGLAQTNPITVTTLGGNIDGTPSQVIQANYGFLQVYSDGTNYYIADSNLVPEGEQWVNVNATSQTLSVNTGYYTTGIGTSTLTLPTTAAVGSFIDVLSAGNGAFGLFTIVQGAGQSIGFGNSLTTVGPTGSLSATNSGDAVRLLCTVANTTFRVLNSVGNLTVV